MSSNWGRNVRLTIFGESHGAAIGVVLDGIKPGIRLDLDFMKEQMKRRAPGRNQLSTSRQEDDEIEFLSGVVDGRTTGTPITCIIRNNDTRTIDYSEMKNTFRPSHADYTGWVKYRGFNDYRGGGHFSGRITAGLVCAGSIAMQILSDKGIFIGSHILGIGKVKGRSLLNSEISIEDIKKLQKKDFPVLDQELSIRMQDEILLAKSEQDSIGGLVETVVLGLSPGIGDPFFQSTESILSSLLFSVPGVKGVEFGRGFEISEMRGSEANDNMVFEGDKINCSTNNNGGILGGITNGMPLIFRTAVKPTPSIGKKQITVDIGLGLEKELETKGRHDPCIVSRVAPVLDAVTSIGLLDMIMEDGKWD
jgi:chorismate synthase